MGGIIYFLSVEKLDKKGSNNRRGSNLNFRKYG